MNDFKQLPIDEMEAIWGGGFKRARAALGVTAFGLSVSDLPPNFDRVPPHVHSFDGQEEVYVALAGDGLLEIDGRLVPIDTETAVRVGPGAVRRPLSGPNGLRLLCVGATAGKPYEPFPNSEPGAPEPDVTDLPGVAAAREAEHGTGEYTAKRFVEMNAITGYFKGVKFTPLRRELDVSAFGIGMFEIEGIDDSEYPYHDHTGDGQEEVFIPLAGSGEIEIEGCGRLPIVPGEMIRVAPSLKRTVHPGAEGIRVLALGGTPGSAYEPPQRAG